MLHALGCFWECLSLADVVTASYSNFHLALQAFDSVINWAFTAMLIIYGAVAGLGYYYFGDAASTLITEDLATNSPFVGRSVTYRSIELLC